MTLQIHFIRTLYQQQRISAFRRRVDTRILELLGKRPSGVARLGWHDKTEAIDAQARAAILARIEEVGIARVRQNAGGIYVHTSLPDLAECLHQMCLGGAFQCGMQRADRYIEEWLQARRDTLRPKKAEAEAGEGEEG